ncbi:protein-methionine-sulfoxide reductase catalytic subunit MsrP [Singulisphaera sp. PoT]|uniref:protein-methionine-sulfoxide reductase catalytic subunit MsrP n=1 Tax=Singulisphaera sp. PoT TaxID=3411797 RepID=UPI003BF5C31C
MPGPDRIPSSEITPPEAYFNRRAFMRAGAAAASLATTAAVYRRLNRPGSESIETAPLRDLAAGTGKPDDLASGFRTEEAKTPLERVGNYNNFYEFTTDKEGVAAAAVGFVSRPWTVEVGGLVRKPKVFDLDEILKLGALEERVYRMRCVEGWSMVIPWDGFSLSRLLDRVEPMGNARYVAFETLVDADRFPGQKSSVLSWPYVEGLRLDEAMHPLTILAAGLYGRELPAQNGAPLRLVVPWKYGFKGIKSIVKITLSEDQPPSTWNALAPSEYGFYSNVNPAVPHPRWSQATEQRIGEWGRRKTLLFNGYAKQVAHLYAGMDLRADF